MNATATIVAGSLAADLDLALAATRTAGECAMRYFRTAHRTWEKGPGQIVTEADVAIDRFLKERLLAERPGYGWLSEESEDDPARLGRERVWVVDPIDGTRSFAEGTPEFSISVALVEGGAPVLGIVLNPATDELFAAARGQGTTLNGRPVRATARQALPGARIVASTFESKRHHFPEILPEVEVTTIGSLAYKLALVACGRFDGYLSWRRTHDWDIAGAAVLLAEAGGTLTDADGRPIALNRERPVHDGLVAAGNALHRPLLQATHQARAAFLERRAKRR